MVADTPGGQWLAIIGLIREIQLYHRPYGQVLAFAAELAQRLAQP